MKIKIIKFRDDLIPPVRAHYNDAGIDCFAQEDFTLRRFIAWLLTLITHVLKLQIDI